MLTQEQLQENKQEFIELLRTIKRDGDIEGLIAYLEATDFFVAPASTQYHCSFPGGLCLHSLNVYKVLKRLVKNFASEVVNTENKETGEVSKEIVPNYSEDTMIIVGLLHDLGKINFYEPSVKNTKVYSPYGKKEDSLGNFDWKEERCYAVKRPEDRDIIGTKGFTANYITSMFIPLLKEETVTLTNQYSAIEREPLPDLSNVLGKYGLSVLLHAADIIATYVVEK